MPRATIVDMPPAEQARLLAEVRRARYGYLLAVHLLLLCAAGRTLTEIAAVLFCSRSTISRVVRAYRAGDWARLAEDGAGSGVEQRAGLSPTLRRSVLVLRQAVPRACGWCRTRWSCATVALELQARRGIVVSAETVRRWRHELGWAWKRAQLVAKDEDPQRVEKLARIRYTFEQLRAGLALFFADELDISLLPKGGYHWMPKGEQVEVLTPGTNEKRSLAGALDITTGTTQHCVWYRKTTGLFLDLLATLDRASPAPHFSRLSVVVDTAKIHHAAEVEKWLAAPPRLALRARPTDCPQANPIERAFGAVQATWTRNPTRTRLGQLGQDVEQHLQVHGPWAYALSDLSDTPAVTAAVQALRAAETTLAETSPLAA